MKPGDTFTYTWNKLDAPHTPAELKDGILLTWPEQGGVAAGALFVPGLALALSQRALMQRVALALEGLLEVAKRKAP